MKPLKQILSIIILGLLSLGVTETFAQCNGSNNVCDKKYNEVAFLTTHNAYNSLEDDFTFPNQNLNITTQLNAGVRGLMIDIYDEEGIITVYHAYTALGTAPFTDFLQDIKIFLDENPNEIISIILESYTTSTAVEEDLNSVGLMDYLFSFDANMGWPTLQTMIDNNKRLVIFSEADNGESNQNWYHYIWDYATETHFSNKAIDEFSCDFNRGDPNNELFILNHFITNDLGVGVEAEAEAANANPFFINRVLQCQEETGKFPNFVAVDFYELGNCFEVVEALNQQIISSINILDSESEIIKLYPNPVEQILTIEAQKIDVKGINVFNILGENISNLLIINQVNQSKISIDFSALETNLYFVKTPNGMTKILHQ